MIRSTLSTLLLLSAVLLTGCTDASHEPSESRLTEDLRRWITTDALDSIRVGIERSESQDEVPIGAVCIVGTEEGRRLFTGSNSMQSSAAGHAEINAIQGAIDLLGADALSPDSTWIITSFEPCPMCTGALADVWKIRPDHVAVLMMKRSEWKEDEQDAVQKMRKGWIRTGLDSIQREAFCRDSRYAREYSEDCR